MNGITITKATGLLFYGEDDTRRTWYDLKIVGFSPIVLLAKNKREAKAKAKKVLIEMGFA